MTWNDGVQQANGIVSGVDDVFEVRDICSICFCAGFAKIATIAIATISCFGIVFFWSFCVWSCFSLACNAFAASSFGSHRASALSYLLLSNLSLSSNLSLFSFHFFLLSLHLFHFFQMLRLMPLDLHLRRSCRSHTSHTLSHPLPAGGTSRHSAGSMRRNSLICVSQKSNEIDLKWFIQCVYIYIDLLFWYNFDLKL